MTHPNDKNLYVVNPPPIYSWRSRASDLMTTLPLIAAFGFAAAIVIIFSVLFIRVAVGDFNFRLGVHYLAWVGAYLGLVTVCVIIHAMNFELPKFTTRWEKENEKDRTPDPFDVME